MINFCENTEYIFFDDWWKIEKFGTNEKKKKRITTEQNMNWNQAYKMGNRGILSGTEWSFEHKNS